jgi:hypothetical protein
VILILLGLTQFDVKVPKNLNNHSISYLYLGIQLRSEGHIPRWACVRQRLSVRRLGNKEVQPDLTIANLAGDRPEDLRLCKLLAIPGQALLIVISSQLQSNQLLEMFEAGITDDLARPVNLREPVARVRNILHRTQPPFQLDGTAVFLDSQPILAIRPHHQQGLCATWPDGWSAVFLNEPLKASHPTSTGWLRAGCRAGR